MHCLIQFVALSVLLCTIGVHGKGPCQKPHFLSLRPFVGVFIPQCTDSGYFKAIQTHPSTGYSWCVHPEKGEPIGAQVKPGAGPPQCGRCFLALEKFYSAGSVLGHILGRNKPQCDANGLFTPVQSSGSTGYSWCVYTQTGIKIQGTDVAPGKGLAKCGGAATAAPAKKPASGKCAQEAEKSPAGLVGSYKPQCTSTGNYELIQSHPSTGFSWCVNSKTGQKIEGSQVRGKPNCPTCLEQLAQSLDIAFFDELHNDQCEDDGKFSSVQTDKKGHTWCVDRETGVHISKAQVPDNVDKSKCIEEPLGPCAQETAYVSLINLGEFVPACDAKGFYASMQTNEGHRYCVDTNTGVQLPGSPKFGPGNTDKLPCEN